MKTILSIAWLCALAASLSAAQQAQPVRFAAVDLVVDSGDQPLAAYQYELAAETGRIEIVGIEGGEHPAFRQPPYYDPEALAHDRIILAAFNTGTDLPTGRTRVARIHIQIIGEAEPELVGTLHAAASVDGKPLQAVATLVKEAAK